MEYKKTLNRIDEKIEKLLNDILEENIYKNPKTDERLTALCLSRGYIKEKVEQLENDEVLLTSLLDIDGYPNEVNNEG